MASAWIQRAKARLVGIRASFKHRWKQRRDTESPKTGRRRRILIGVGIVVALLAYPVLGTLALWTGFVEWVLRSEDLRVEIDNPAYTIWPGHVHMKRAKILVNGETQFTLEGHDLLAHISLLPMVKRRFYVTKLDVRDVRYRMRVQVESTRGIEERIAAYPPLRELPGAKVLREKEAAKTEEREKSWTVEVEGIDANVTELWFMEYRYLGDGTLKGGFLVGPDVMRVATSVQDLGPGELRFGPEQLIAKNFRGRIVATIPEVNPNEHNDTRFLDFVTARISLKADVQTLRHVSAYVDGVDFSAGKGTFGADFLLEKGWLGKKSTLGYETDSIRLNGKGFGVESDWKIAMEVQSESSKDQPNPQRDQKAKLRIEASKPAESERPRLHSQAETTYVSFARPGSKDVFTVQVHDHEQEATLKSTQIGSGMALENARLDFPKIVTKDLEDLDAVTAEAGSLSVERGQALASARLRVDENYVVRGPIRLAVDDLKLRAANITLGGKARVRTGLRFDTKSKATRLEDVEFRLTDALMHVGDERVENWWMVLAAERAVASGLPPKGYETILGIRAKDAEPLLEALAEKDELNDLIAKFTSLDDLTLVVKIRGAGKVTDVTIESLESDVWDVAGRMYSDGKRTRTAIVLGGKAVSLGIASDGKNTEIEPFARTDWLNARLRTFPKPAERIAPSKP